MIYNSLDIEDLNFDKDKFNFENNTFDLFVSLAVLEHLNNPYLFLNEIRRVLKMNHAYFYLHRIGNIVKISSLMMSRMLNLILQSH